MKGLGFCYYFVLFGLVLVLGFIGGLLWVFCWLVSLLCFFALVGLFFNAGESLPYSCYELHT